MFYLYQSDDGRVTAIAVDLLQVKPVAAWFGEPMADGEPVAVAVARRLVGRFGGQIIDRGGITSHEPPDRQPCSDDAAGNRQAG